MIQFKLNESFVADGSGPGGNQMQNSSKVFDFQPVEILHKAKKYISSLLIPFQLPAGRPLEAAGVHLWLLQSSLPGRHQVMQTSPTL